jgi:hypothetical protein
VWSALVPCTTTSGSPCPLRQTAIGAPSGELTVISD